MISSFTLVMWNKYSLGTEEDLHSGYPELYLIEFLSNEIESGIILER